MTSRRKLKAEIRRIEADLQQVTRQMDDSDVEKFANMIANAPDGLHVFLRLDDGGRVRVILKRNTYRLAPYEDQT